MTPLELAKAEPWARVLFTTYALSLSFFESVLLDRLVRGGSKQALILADPDGVRAALCEQGARRAGRDYRLEPVAPSRGVFHAKLSVFEGADDCHLLVGSGNLTFGGWGANLECIEHLHPSFAADAFDDLAEFFQLLAIDDTIRMDARESCAALGERLTKLPRGVRDGRIRLLHSIGGSLAAELRRHADDLGGATRLTVAAPYFDAKGEAITQLAAELGLEEVHVHVHPASTVTGSLGANWPVQAAVAVRAVCVASLATDERQLHAKMFEVGCKRGRLLLSGSANATSAALSSDRNVECSVLRVDRASRTLWVLQPSAAPSDLHVPTEAADDAQSNEGVVRAELNGDALTGLVLRPRLSGPVEVSVVTQRQTISLGMADVNSSGRFELSCPGLEMDSWSAGRLTIRVRQGSCSALGFISLGIAFELTRRAGPVGTRIAALLSGSETPEDVAAIFAWLADDPNRIPSAARVTGAGSDQPDWRGSGPTVTAVDLTGPLHAGTGDQSNEHDGKAWQRLYDMLRAAFRRRQSRFSLDDIDSENEAARAERVGRTAKANRQVERSFPALLTAMLRPQNAGCFALIALDMASYVCARFDVSSGVAGSWLQQCLVAVPQELSEGDQSLIAGAALLYFHSRGEAGEPWAARRYLLHRSLLHTVPADPEDSLAGLHAVLGQSFNLECARNAVLEQLTPGEEVAEYRRALDAQSPEMRSFNGLRTRPQWGELEHVLRQPSRRARLIFTEEVTKSCPRCSMSLPLWQVSDLRQYGVASASNCCGRPVLCEAI